MYSIDVEIVGHAEKLDMKLVRKWFSFVCCVHACQALLLRSELTNNTS